MELEDVTAVELRDRLVEVLLCQAEAARVAAPWVRGEALVAPKAQLEQLGTTMRGLEAAVVGAIREAQVVYRMLEARYAEQVAAEQARAAAMRS